MKYINKNPPATTNYFEIAEYKATHRRKTKAAHHSGRKEEKASKVAAMKEFCYREIEAATEDFSLSRLIGKGSHGCVYKGSLPSRGRLGDVAVKKPSLALQILGDNTKLDNEINIMLSLPRKSQYIVNLHGVATTIRNDHCASSVSRTCNGGGKEKLLVMEYMPNGSLHDLLHTSPDPPSWPKRALIALRLARAVCLLHYSSPPIVHRDIKSANILFDANWNSKLADFGLAVRFTNELSQLKSQPAGTIGYLDPSYTTPGKLSTKNDVFSFGVVLLEIISCRRAIDVAMDPSSIVDWATPMIQDQSTQLKVCDPRVLLPSSMEGTVRCMLKIAARCVSSEEQSRPSMGEVVTELELCLLAGRIRRFPKALLASILSISRRGLGRESRKIRVIKCTNIQNNDHEGDDDSKNEKKQVIMLSVREILADERLS